MKNDKYVVFKDEINLYENNANIKMDNLSEDDIKIVMTVTDEIGRVFVREFSSENDFTGEREVY
ncbi:MAG: hypothetical protein U9Q80_09745 [Bacillota bacterium]|nr:hypothetical protein [Bacillota bacterium]